MKHFRIFLFSCLLISLQLVFAKESESVSEDQNDVYKNLDLFTSALAIVQRDYVDDASSQDLIYGSLSGMLHALDPHSQFLTPEDYKEIQVETEGKFSGIGTEITVRKGYLTVVSAIEGTPAFEAGIRPKDRIVSIDGVSTRQMSIEKAVKLLRGQRNSTVRLQIARKKSSQLLSFEMKRDVIHIQSVKQVKIIGQDIGYIRMSEFQEQSGPDMERHLKFFNEQKVKGMILDLRNNPGGLLQASVEVVDKFIDKGVLVVSIKGRRANQNMTFYSKEGILFSNPVVVLINEGSASAAEIVAGAFQDLKRGQIVGVKSFGKGSVQSVIPLRDGSALKLTTAKYFIPSGKTIHGMGIIPDVMVPLSEDEIKEKRQHMNNKDELWLDAQLQVAIAILRNEPYDGILNRVQK